MTRFQLNAPVSISFLIRTDVIERSL